MKRSKIIWVSALAVGLSVLTTAGAFAATDTKHISDGAAKGQATEGMAHSTGAGTGGAHGPAGLHVRRKLPGRMKSGTLTLTRGVKTNPSHHNMIGNHKDLAAKH